MTDRRELLEATDATIDDAVSHADPMVLRGLIYQLTGDERLATLPTGMTTAGFMDLATIPDPADVRYVQERAARFLKEYRDAGAGPLDVGPHDRLRASLSLAAGFDVAPAELEMWIEELALDPYARGVEWAGEPPADTLRDFSVLVIGAGMGGLNAGVMLKKAGVAFTILEKDTEVGGTWHKNRYPGARVDSPSRAYTHIHGVDFPYPYQYCPQPENEKYFNWVADNYGVREHIEFETEVRSIIWDEDSRTWLVTGTRHGEQREWRANAVISCVGYLSHPNMPTFAGAEEFRGSMFHTASWPADLDVTGKRVAVIGSGCTGYQLVPEVARTAEQVYVVQRTPSWVFGVPGYLDPLPPQVNWLDRNLPFHTNFVRFRMKTRTRPESLLAAYSIDPTFEDEHAVSAVNKRIREQRLDFMREKFAGRPDLIEKMTPIAPPMSSRPVLVDKDYSIYDALVLDNVSLVTSGVERITPDGLRTADGQECDVDIIALATGFRAEDFVLPIEVRGRNGVRVEDLWAKDGARAYVGTMLPGFPNFFMVYGPNTNPIGGLQVVDFEELVTRFAVGCISGLIEQGKQCVDVDVDSYIRYNDEVDRAEALRIYRDPRVRTYYSNDYGRSSGMMSLDVRLFWYWLRSPAGRRARDDQARLDESLEPVREKVRPFFGEDLIVD